MTEGAEPLPPPNPVLKCEVSHEIIARLYQVRDRSGLSIREILSQAIDFAWHVEFSEELSGRYNATDAQQQGTPTDAPRKTPPVLPAEGSERLLAQVELGDIVRLKKPYQPVIGTDRQPGPFGFGIVAEIIHVLPDGRTRNVSLYLYDPERREIFLGPNGICEFVDFHCSELELYKRATEQGYIPLLTRNRWAMSKGSRHQAQTDHPPFQPDAE